MVVTIKHPELAKLFLKGEDCSQEAYDTLIRISAENGAMIMTPQVLLAGLIEAHWIEMSVPL